MGVCSKVVPSPAAAAAASLPRDQNTDWEPPFKPKVHTHGPPAAVVIAANPTAPETTAQVMQLGRRYSRSAPDSRSNGLPSNAITYLKSELCWLPNAWGPNRYANAPRTAPLANLPPPATEARPPRVLLATSASTLLPVGRNCPTNAVTPAADAPALHLPPDMADPAHPTSAPAPAWNNLAGCRNEGSPSNPGMAGAGGPVPELRAPGV